jgi:hypothetical protein
VIPCYATAVEPRPCDSPIHKAGAVLELSVVQLCSCVFCTRPMKWRVGFYVCKDRLYMDAASAVVQSRTVHPFLINTHARALGREYHVGPKKRFHGMLSEQPAMCLYVALKSRSEQCDCWYKLAVYGYPGG